ncbi:MAG: DUF3421 domain-containing protein [Pseudorhodoplanes sp.]|uniref:DUF3421 domain-containing protein n=1 Tax=Pseudorhodoplanes sp. TaxID=1934341 RepID=UPI003D0EFC65
MFLERTWRRGAIACLALFAGFQFSCEAAAHAQAKPYARKGEWIVEVIPDRSGRPSFCRAKRPYGTETWLAFSSGKGRFAIEFSGPGSLVAGDKYAVQFWIDRPRSEGPTSTFAAKVDDPNDWEFMRIRDNIDEIGDIDLLMNGKVLHIRSASEKWQYDLRGANAALQTLFECRDRVVLNQKAPPVAQAAPPPSPAVNPRPRNAPLDWVKTAPGRPMDPRAKPAGTMPDGLGVFACIGAHNGGMHPGTAGVWIEGCSIGFGGREIVARNYSVMLGTGRWVAASQGTIPQRAHAGGHEADGQPLYVCRVRLQDGTFVGKIRRGFNGCNYSDRGRERTAGSYDVLTE